jgi:hypothetical protein
VEARKKKKSIRQHTSACVSQDTSEYEAGEAAQKHTSACVRIRQDTSEYEAGEAAKKKAYVRIRQDTASGYVRMPTVRIRHIRSRRGCRRRFSRGLDDSSFSVSAHLRPYETHALKHTLGYVRILRQDTSAYVRIRQHTKQARLHKSIRQHESACVRIREDTKQARLQKKKSIRWDSEDTA